MLNEFVDSCVTSHLVCILCPFLLLHISEGFNIFCIKLGTHAKSSGKYLGNTFGAHCTPTVPNVFDDDFEFSRAKHVLSVVATKFLFIFLG